MKRFKKILPLLLVLMLTINYLHAQNAYSPINFDHGRWIFVNNYEKGPFWGTNYERDTLRYYFNGDTLISNHQYRKLYFTGKSYSYNGSKIVSGYAGAFRDDTLHRTVWYGWVGTQIAYDYNLSISDTVKQGSGKGAVVDKIDSVFYCGKYFHRFIYKDAPIEYSQIENISALDFCFRYFFLSNLRLICYYETNSTACNTCGGTLKANFINAGHYSFYPNPTNGEIHIRSFEGLKLIAVYNSSGNLVVERNEAKTQFTIDLSNYSPGIYMVTIMADKGIYTEKIVKK